MVDHAIGQDRNIAAPTIRKIGIDDLKDALRKGVDDFRLMPSYLVMLALLYPVVGLVAARWSMGNDVLPIIFPLISGFALVGPIAAVGLYELSRRREKGLDTYWQHVFDVLKSPALGTIILLGVLLTAIFVGWLVAAMTLHTALFGTPEPSSIRAFLTEIFSTSAGWKLILFGNAIGFVFAVVTLAVSAVSFPLALDRNVDFTTAVTTSVRAMIANPGTMLAWGFIVAAALAIGAVPFFMGLAVVMPILGHATWHLYRKLVV
jgi:uncharacterized membrane protein